MTERVARACASRPWRVLGGWVLAVVVSVVLIASFLGEALTNTAEVTTPTDSKRGWGAARPPPRWWWSAPRH